MLNLGHVMGQYEVSRAHHHHAFSLLIDHVRVGRDFGKNFSRIYVIIVDWAVALIVQGRKHLHKRVRERADRLQTGDAIISCA